MKGNENCFELAEIELLSYRITEGKILEMYERNPWENDVGSSQREVRVSEGSSYRESTDLAQFGSCDQLVT